MVVLCLNIVMNLFVYFILVVEVIIICLDIILWFIKIMMQVNNIDFILRVDIV